MKITFIGGSHHGEQIECSEPSAEIEMARLERTLMRIEPSPEPTVSFEHELYLLEEYADGPKRMQVYRHSKLPVSEAGKMMEYVYRMQE